MELSPELREAQEFFHAKIPITRAMGVRVVPHADGFAVEAPVALNRNHLETAFGGSINAVATLAAYGLLWTTLRGSGAQLVVSESTIRFLRPVRELLRAVCLPPGEMELATFHETLRRKGKARIGMLVHVEEAGANAAEFRGSFTAFMDTVVR